MSNFKQAPQLTFNAVKLSKKEHYYGLSQKLMDYVLNELSGREGNCIKLMIVLLGTSQGFKLSQQWVSERTGLSKDAYYKARKQLEEKGMIIVSDKYITVNVKGMLEKYSKEKESINETYSKSINEKYQKSSFQTYHNRKENIKNNIQSQEEKEEKNVLSDVMEDFSPQEFWQQRGVKNE